MRLNYVENRAREPSKRPTKQPMRVCGNAMEPMEIIKYHVTIETITQHTYIIPQQRDTNTHAYPVEVDPLRGVLARVEELLLQA